VVIVNAEGIPFISGLHTIVCTENLIRIDCATESPKRQRR